MRKLIILLGIAILSVNYSYGQLDTMIAKCSKLISYPYMSDGQHYIALVQKGETAEFYFTFYGEATYRIVACTGDGSIAPIFRVYDKDRKLLFSSEYYHRPKYWDFKFTSTIEAIVEAQLPDDGPSSGIILVLLGFK